MNSFSVEQKRVDVFESAAPNKPVIYLNTYGREGAQIFQYLTDIGCQDFSLVAVSKLEWNHAMGYSAHIQKWCIIYQRSR